MKPTPARSVLCGLLAALAVAGCGSGGFPTTPREEEAAARQVGPAFFRDVTADSGISFTCRNGEEADQYTILESLGGGVGLLDYDGDGRLDVYLVQGGDFPPDPTRPASGDRLFRNRGDGTFEDVTTAAGLTAFPGGYGHGVAVGDYDNDGRPDLFVTRWQSYALYRNRGDGILALGNAKLPRMLEPISPHPSLPKAA